ncbi:HAD family hydrolase [Hoeflea poritis]|uniref:HAD family phosphatase n=1 Tax=Hoeflea poritis TaxID=2993659 RepID=A0ABT4VKX1_9HYPH|nr:HAD family phosphatase [Hoeflea poritis]MDA4844800.1 HAD family phosphatase [Hoeflea poritis]
MTQPTINHVVFDIGRVLLHYDPQIPFSRIIPDEHDRRWFFENVCTHDWNIEQDRGRGWQEAEQLLIEIHPDHAENIRAFRSNWHEMVPHAYEGSVEIMRGLMEGGHDVTMLTNFASDTFREVQERFDFLNETRGVTVSGDIGVIKPQREIYDSHVASFALEPAETLFIDDSPANVEGARAAGWHAVHFTGADQLASDLEKLGVNY